MKLFDSTTRFDDDVSENKLIIHRSQHIPDDFVADLKRQKIESTSVREREFMHVAAIPVIIHEKWLKEGYDCTRAPVRETLRRLRREQLDAFIVTNKQV